MSFSIWNPLQAVTSYIAGWFSSSSDSSEDPSSSEPATGPDPSAQEHETESASTESGPAVHREKHMRYGVALPKHAPLQDDDRPPFVFERMKDVLQFCRRYHYEYPRWKLAPNAAAAQQFSLSAFDSDQEEQQRVDKEALPFKSLAPQELVRLRKAIEGGSVEEVTEMIESNPRFLVGSGDTPTILQEGCRYNAFHVAAKANQAEIMRRLFEKLRCPNYFKRLYPDDDERSTSDRIAYIVDLYLNMPDKTKKGETPLHFATKYGAVECVKFLLEQEACDRDAPNCEGDIAENIVCARAGGDKHKKEILLLFEQIFLIPIVRDYDGDGIPKLESPITVNIFQDIYSPRRSSRKILSGLIGPVSSPRAFEILTELKQTRYKPADVDLRNRDADKGFETVARNTARKYGAPWREYWTFLNSSVDLASKEGQARLNSYLNGRRYISGNSPTKSDYDVFSALTPVLDDIQKDASLPQVQRWLRSMRKFSREEMKSWRTPKKASPKTTGRHPDAAENEHCLVNLMEKFNVAAATS